MSSETLELISEHDSAGRIPTANLLPELDRAGMVARGE
jgi:hypothetical protein